MYGVHSLRERALDAGACTVLGGVRLLCLTHPGDLQCRMLRARAQREQTPGRASAARFEGAHLAMPAGEARPHHHPPLTGVDRPALARMAGRTGCDLLIPIELEVLEGEGARRSGLPLLVLGRWPNEHHTVVADAGHQLFRVNIPGIHQMRARQRILRTHAGTSESGLRGTKVSE